MQLAGCDDGCRAGCAVEQAELSEVIADPERAGGWPPQRLGRPGKDDVQRVSWLPPLDDDVAWFVLGEPCGSDEFSQSALGDAGEYWKGRQHFRPIRRIGAIPVPGAWL